jgi:signal transduction histidine kinase
MSTADIIKIGAAILVGVLNVFLGFSVLLQNRRKLVNRLFFLITFCFALWSFSMIFYQYADITQGWLWVRVMYSFVTLFAIFNLLFSHAYPIINIPQKKFISLVCFSGIYIILTFWLLWATPLWIIRVYDNLEKGRQTVLGNGYTYWGIISLGLLFYSSWNLYYKSKRMNPVQRLQIQFYWFGFVLFGIAQLILDLLLPLIYNDTSTFFTSIFSNLLFTAPVTYAMMRHRLFDIKLFVVRSVVYIFTLTLITFIYASIILITTPAVTHQTFPLYMYFPSIITVVILLLAFQPISGFIQKFAQTRFLKNYTNSDQVLYEFSQTISSTLNINELSDKILPILANALHAKWVFVQLYKSDGTPVTFNYPADCQAKALERDTAHRMLENKSIIITDETTSDADKSVLRQRDASLLIHLCVRNNCLGYIMIGPKNDGQIYFTSDIKLLTTITPELAVAYENINGVEEIRNFSIKLQKEVEDATRDLRQANRQLKQLDQLKDEFISIASHDLRTPLSAMKGYLWLLMNEDKTNLPPASYDRLIRIYNSTERMIMLLNDMLDISRIEGDRIDLLTEPFNIVELTQNAIDEMKTQINEKGISITFTPDKPEFIVLADHNRILQILINLIDNAVKYNHENGTIDISIRQANLYIEVVIKDSGIGINPLDIPKLFTKFGRLDNSFSGMSSTPGTGLGLYICWQIIERSGGNIWVESEPGSGSAFHFTLPKAD